MHAQMRPDGAIVLTIDDAELIDLESALMNGEILCRASSGDEDLTEDDRYDATEAANWLEKMADVIGAAEGRPISGRPTLRSV